MAKLNYLERSEKPRIPYEFHEKPRPLTFDDVIGRRESTAREERNREREHLDTHKILTAKNSFPLIERPDPDRDIRAMRSETVGRRQAERIVLPKDKRAR